MRLSSESKIASYLDKIIIINTYFFALGLIISKALTSITGGLICLLWLIRIIFIKDYQFKSNHLNLAILFFILSLGISLVGNWNNNGLNDFFKYFWLVILYFAIINTVKDLKTVKSLVYLSLLSMSIAGIYGLYQHYILKLNRINGFFLVLGFGVLLAIFIIYNITYLLWGNINISKKIGLLILLVIFALDLLFTQARGAWLAFIGGTTILFWLKDKKYILWLLVILVIAALILPQSYLNRFISSFNITDNRSNLTRIALWKGALLMWSDNPINGVGIGNFQKVYEDEYLESNVGTTVNAHNNFLQVAAETGIIGLIAFIWLMISIFKFLYKKYVCLKDDNLGLFILASLIGFIVFYFHGLTDVNFIEAGTIRFYWFLLAINVAFIDQLSVEKE